MNEAAVAYSFSLSTEGSGKGKSEEGRLTGSVRVGRVVTMFTSSEACRGTLRSESPAVPVIVCNGTGGVSPINLAAALCADAPERDVYLMEDWPTESLARRARAAGIRGILNRTQADRLLALDAETIVRQPHEGLCMPAPVPVPAVTPPLSSVPAATPFAVPAPVAASLAESVPVAASSATSVPNLSTPVPATTLPAPATTTPVSAATFLAPVPAATLPAPVPAAPVSPASAVSAIATTLPAPAPAAPAPATLATTATTSIMPVVSLAAPRLSFGQGRVVGFFSGRGGVGKSTVALMTALVAQRRGARVALVDLDLQFGDMGYLVGREPSNGIRQLSLAQLCAEEDPPVLSDEELVLVLAPERPEQGEQCAPAIPRLLRGLATRRDLVVVNTGSFWTDVHARTVQHCDHLVFLMDQRATSIEACKQVVDLCLRLQTSQIRFHYLLNGCGRHAVLTPLDVGLALGGVQVGGLADGGTLVDELLALGCPFELLGSGNAFIASLEGFLDDLMGQQAMRATLEQSGRAERHGAKLFDLAALRGFFEGARRVAT